MLVYLFWYSCIWNITVWTFGSLLSEWLHLIYLYLYCWYYWTFWVYWLAEYIIFRKIKQMFMNVYVFYAYIEFILLAVTILLLFEMIFIFVFWPFRSGFYTGLNQLSSPHPPPHLHWLNSSIPYKLLNYNQCELDCMVGPNWFNPCHTSLKLDSWTRIHSWTVKLFIYFCCTQLLSFVFYSSSKVLFIVYIFLVELIFNILQKTLFVCFFIHSSGSFKNRSFELYSHDPLPSLIKFAPNLHTDQP